MEFILGLTELPFDQDENQFIYIENEYDKDVNSYILKNYDSIREHFHSQGVSFIYIPKRLEEIRRAEIISFNAPYAKSIKDVSIGSDFLLEYMVHPENRKEIQPSLIYYNPRKNNAKYTDAVVQYQGIELTPDSGYKKTRNLSNILSQIKENIIDRAPEETDKSEVLSEQPRFSINIHALDVLKKFSHQCVDEDYYPSEKSQADARQSIEKDNDEEEIQKKLDELKQIVSELRMRGVDDYIFQKTIFGEEELSRLLITKDYRIFLPDYKNIEIELGPLPKAMFLLYLRHPEGIYQKELSDYREELMKIYRTIKGGLFNEFEARKSIESMTTSNKNSANEKIASIKKAFGSKFKDSIASNYYISGVMREKKKITLPQDLIIWEKPI